MPGNRPHHTDKWRSCVEKVMAQGHDESSASAICTSSMQKAGEPIFEGAESRSAEELRLLEEPRHTELRQLHLRSALGKIRKQMFNGREHLIVPVVALMEGVIHAVNADTPEYVPLQALAASVQNWNGRPLMLNHPVKNGVHIPANNPEVLEAQSFGNIFNTRMDGKRLLMDAYIDPSRLKQLGREDMIAALEAEQLIEVSVGAHVVTNSSRGEFNGKPYKAAWQVIDPDHLAFLPEGRGACSLEMGCGACRAASYRVMESTLEIDESDARQLAMKKDCPMCQGSGSKDGNPCEACDGTGKLKVAKEMPLRHEGGKWIIYSRDGRRRLASHSTREEAIARQQAIDAALQRRDLERHT